jgi:hypothetical protein
MILLVSVLGVLTLLCALLVVRELREERRYVERVEAARDANSSAAGAAPLVWQLVFHGGPCDGGTVAVSESVARVAFVHLVSADHGFYTLETVNVTAGGCVKSFRWCDLSEVGS